MNSQESHHFFKTFSPSIRATEEENGTEMGRISTEKYPATSSFVSVPFNIENQLSVPNQLYIS